MRMRKQYIALGKQLLQTHQDPRALPRYQDNTYAIGEEALSDNVPKGVPQL